LATIIYIIGSTLLPFSEPFKEQLKIVIDKRINIVTGLIVVSLIDELINPGIQ
jgi:hypothetical protein